MPQITPLVILPTTMTIPTWAVVVAIILGVLILLCILQPVYKVIKCILTVVFHLLKCIFCCPCCEKDEYERVDS